MIGQTWARSAGNLSECEGSQTHLIEQKKHELADSSGSRVIKLYILIIKPLKVQAIFCKEIRPLIKKTLFISLVNSTESVQASKNDCNCVEIDTHVIEQQTHKGS